MEDMRMVKFETLIGDVNERLRKGTNFIFVKKAAMFGKSGLRNNYQMELIFDFEKLNAYGKKVLENSQTDCRNKYSFDETMKKDSMQATKIMIQMYRKSGRGLMGELAPDEDQCSYYFIFWALFTLAVDKTDFEEKLSLICDFAKMLQISDEEVLDIVKVIKYIFREETSPEFASGTIPVIFVNVLEMYE